MAESGKDRIKAFLLDNIGEVVTAKQLQEAAAPVSEWARRVRELRDEGGWPISSQHDDHHLKSGEYRLTGPPPEMADGSRKRGLSQRLKAEVLDRDGSVCQWCGLAAGEIDPDTGRKVRMHVAHIIDKSHGGKDELDNLRSLCSTCNQGAKNITTTKPEWSYLKTMIRRANEKDQRAVREWLNEKFKD